MSWNERVALITGAAAGIGRAAALLLAGEGVRVVCADIDGSGAEAAALEAREAGGEALAWCGDVSVSEQAQDMVARAVAAFGRLDFAFNNAGVEGVLATIDECSDDDWSRVIDVNLTGVWLCMKHEVRAMRETGGGSIVNTSSVMGRVANARSPAYAASKHGVVGLTLSGALAYSKEGIRVNAICPGWTRTPMIDRLIGQDPERERMAVDLHPIGRLGEPREIAQTVRWLFSEESSFVTGAILPVDGGYLAQ